MLKFFVYLCLFHKVFSDYGVLVAESDGNHETGQFCVGFNPRFHKLPKTLNKQTSHRLVDDAHSVGCNDTYSPAVAHTVVAVSRGGCSFVEKTELVQGHLGFAVLVVSLQNESNLIVPGANESSPAEYNAVNITVAYIIYSDYQKIKALGKSVSVTMYAPSSSRLDPNMVLIFLIALLCVVAGGYWSGSAKHSGRDTQSRSNNASSGSSKSDDDDERDSNKLNVTFWFVIILVAVMCVVIVLLYFFYDYLVYVIIGLFCLAGASGLYCCCEPLCERITPCHKKIPPNRIPLLSSEPEIWNLFLAAVCLAVAVFWVVVRNASYGWILQDILGVAFCLNMLKTVLLPSFKGCTILLVILFFYDIFFVFITPYITKSGDSIMVDVATGGKSHSGEQLPMVFKVPRFVESPIDVCGDSSYSLLGFGDVILPGLLVAYNYRFDLTVGSRKVYFIASVIAYCVGLGLTYIALALMKMGQPALLYLVPCTLLTTAAIGWCRGELKHLWAGKEDPKKNDDENPYIPKDLPNIRTESEASSVSSTEGERRGLINI